MMTTSITIIEDDKSFATLLSKILLAESDFICPNIFHNTQSALHQFPENPTDIILMDIQLPDGTGINLTSTFKKEFPETYIIMCTSFDDDEKIFDSLKAGANGYLVKTDTPENIVSAIHEVMQGGAPMSMGIAKKVIQHFRQQELDKPNLEILTKKENELLLHLSKGLFYKEIADLMNVSLDTIKKHCGNIYRKLSVSNRTEAINIYLNR